MMYTAFQTSLIPLIVGDFSTASINWGYSYQNHLGKTVEYLNSNSHTLLYDPGE